MRLDLADNPEKYLRKQAGLDQNGMLIVAIANPTRVPVTGLSIAVQYLDGQGRKRSFQRNLSGSLAAGQQEQIATGLGPFQNPGQFQVAITGARIAQ
jgi:hypothetical protein